MTTVGSPSGEPDFLEAGRKLFAGECRFIWAAARADNLPPTGPPEIAFAGRSNVGKSSLLNALTGRKSLARTSTTPGRTQELNFFAIGDPESARLVDMPGYGYAAVSKEKIAGWTRLMHDFLRGRATLARVFVLVNARHGLKTLDREMLGILDTAAVSYQVVLTKIDELKPPKLAEIETAVLTELRQRVAAHPEIFATSAEAGSGIEALRGGIARLLAERGGLTDPSTRSGPDGGR